MNKPKMRLGDLRRILIEEKKLSSRSNHAITPNNILIALKSRGFLSEAGEQIAQAQKEQGDSLDKQVDRYFADFENSSNDQNSELPNESLTRGLSAWNKLVREASDDQADDESTEPPTDATAEPPPPTKLSIDNLDVEQFANDVARLIENYDSLLEIKRTLVKRAINFIAKNYDDNVVKQFKNSLRDEHGLMADQSKSERDSENFVAPRAGEAGPGGS